MPQTRHRTARATLRLLICLHAIVAFWQVIGMIAAKAGNGVAAAGR